VFDRVRANRRIRPPLGGLSGVFWVIAALLVVIVVLLATRHPGQLSEKAWGQPVRMGARGIFALTGQISRDSYGLFMIDTDAGTVWVYQYLPGNRQLRLVAARSFVHDRHIEDYNSDNPSPAEVAQWVQRARKLKLDSKTTEPEEEKKETSDK